MASWKIELMAGTRNGEILTACANWNITILSTGKSTISMVIFHSYLSLPGGSHGNHEQLSGWWLELGFYFPILIGNGIIIPMDEVIFFGDLPG